MTMRPAPTDIDAVADRILTASDRLTAIAPISDTDANFDLAEAYRVSATITERRRARGEKPVGWKIGFTNRTIWAEYDVHAPIWGPVYDTTFAVVDPASAITCPIGGLMEPRIEPEIAFRLARSPEPGTDAEALLTCIDGVAHGFEIVQSIFPGWRFRAADTVAAFGLHGRLFAGPFRAIADNERDAWLTRLADFEIRLFRDGNEVDREHGGAVLGGPLLALAHFVDGLKAMSGGAIRPGDVVTTGTVTRAFPVRAGEQWSTHIAGLPLAGLTIDFV